MDPRLEETLQPAGDGTMVAVRTFRDETIQRAIEAALADPQLAGASGAIVIHLNASHDGYEASIAARLPGGHWSIAAAGYKPKKGADWAAGAEIGFKW